MKRGQIFTLDVLLALVALTVVLGYMAWQFEQVYSKSYSMEYNKIQMLANDVSQIAVKNTLAKNERPNDLDIAKLQDLQSEIDMIIKLPYSYEVLLPGDTPIHKDVCDGKSNIAVSRRLITTGELIVKVCV